MNRDKLRRALSLGAATGMLAASAYVAVPAWAAGDGSTAEATSPAASPAADPATETPTTPAFSGMSTAGLGDAVQRDLGVTPEQFGAAGELGVLAEGAAAKLSAVPGYTGIRVADGRIIVTGFGAELQEAVHALAAGDTGLPLELEAAAAPESAAPASLAPGSELAASTEQLFQAYVRDVGITGLQAVVSTGSTFVIRTGGVNSPEATADPADGGATHAAGSAVEPGAAADASAKAGSGKTSPAEFVARYANVELDGGAPLTPEADVPGGVGYIADTGWICSTGFSAFDPAGVPAVLTAGHCASDGAAQTADLEFQFNRVGLLGRFGFSQFGGPGNSWVLHPNTAIGPDKTALTDPGNVGTDIAVVESLSPGVNPAPAASTWGDASQPEADVKIIGTADPVAGMPVCRSGRTSAWSCGTVDAVGIFIVPGPTYVEPTETSDPDEPLDLRAFNGFLSYGVQSSGGDSGGPYVSGNYALGTHAAGDTPDKNGNVIQNFAVAATLSDSLAVLPGYQLEIFLNTPVVTSPVAGTTYEPGQVISGNVPAAPATAVAAGSKVRVTIQGQDPFEVPVNSDGSWRFPAPEGRGTLRFTAETVNGFSTSGASSFEFGEAAPAGPMAPPASAEPAPAPVEPAPGQTPGEQAPADPAPAEPAPPGPPAPAGQPPAVVVLPPTSAPADLANTSRNRAGQAANGGLAYTGASALVPAAGAAAAAIVVGAVLMVLVRRRRQRTRG